MRHIALLPAAGGGSRMNASKPKQYLDLLGKPLVWHTLAALHAVPELRRIVVVIAPDDEWWGCHDWSVFDRLTVLRCGGASRAESVLNGLRALSAGEAVNTWILVHDAARPCLEPALVSAMIAELVGHEVGGILAVPVADTLKLATPDRQIVHTYPRTGLWQAQTPQMFRLADLASALAAGLGPDITDEASALEKQGFSPALVMGSPWNLKVTYPQDLQLAALILQARDDAMKLPFRIGQGWDVHRLVAGRKLILGGVAIEFDKGLLGHSDADALLHAITDAVLGAAGLGDIGQHFPDTDIQFKGTDSRVLLREAVRRVNEAGWRIGNVDASILIQQPKMAPHIAAMVMNIATDLGIDAAAVNIKAKTYEKLGPVGQSEAVEAQAVCLLLPLP